MQSVLYYKLLELKNKFAQNKSNIFPSNAVDICSLAKLSLKPVVWVFGQLLHYIMRPRSEIGRIIAHRLATAFNESDTHGIPHKFSGLTVGVNLRGGVPDGNRRVLSVHEVMNIIDERVATLKHLKYHVSKVFICSDTQETNIKSAKYMTNNFPRDFTYVVLPHMNYSSGTEAEFIARASLINGSPLAMAYHFHFERGVSLHQKSFD